MARITKPRLWKAIVAGTALVALFAAARFLPIREWLESFSVWVSRLGVWGGVLYGIVYVVAALLFVPGLVLTLGAGFAFGFLWGTVIVSLASTTAAALAFLIARYLARERVQAWARKHERFEAIDRAIEKNGWKIVALLRLSPLIPFSLSNYLYGLTAVRFLPFVAASWVAMLPATLLYVSLGAAGRSLEEGRERSPWEWAPLGAGLVATIAVTVILTRVARRELQKTRAGKETL